MKLSLGRLPEGAHKKFEHSYKMAPMCAPLMPQVQLH